MKLRWHNKVIARLALRDKRLNPFLFQNGSLSHFIQQRCRDSFHIELIDESWCYPMPDESYLLSSCNRKITFIRESWLKCGKERIVYARTIIPRATLKGESQKLMRLGTKPLGNVLFNDNTTYRTNMRYASIPSHCELHKQASQDTDIASDLWGRQSLFYVNNKPLLVTEVFLPAIMECTQD
ncbi:MAG: putative chorismate pyruvate-lyase [marine bacterium B5-7]|nr:MAG: putative chorismate pyruvate-lyase [marine bacterium B5-7]